MNPIYRLTRTRIHWPMVLLALWLGMTACAGSRGAFRTDFGSGQNSLDLWLDQALIPYLIAQFDRHPRFRAQPVMLVRMQDENVLPRIDELTEQIRQKITDAMLKQPGLELAWRPSVQSWQHHQRLEDISCSAYNDVRYYVGIDAGLAQAGRQLYVKVRGLNLAENKWITGFGKSWQGVPTEEHKKALSREHVDEHLLGLRPLPFSEQQPDMLAAYLARNLSCLLQQGEADALVVYVDRADVSRPQTFRTALDLLGRYLARFREVEVTDDPDQANVTIVAAIHAIDQRLHQVWVSARLREGDKYLRGAGTEAYITLEAFNERPLDTARVDVNTVSASPLQPFRDRSEHLQIITTFDLLKAPDQRYCANGSNRRSGVKRVDSREILFSGSCVTIEAEISAPAYLFLMGQDATGELSRVFPSDCLFPDRPVARMHPAGRFRFPADSESPDGVLQIGGTPGMESIYAVAITAAGLAGMFAERIKNIQGVCRSGAKYPHMLESASLRFPHERVQRWQNYLTWLSQNHPQMVDWREIRFQHERR